MSSFSFTRKSCFDSNSLNSAYHDTVNLKQGDLPLVHGRVKARVFLIDKIQWTSVLRTCRLISAKKKIDSNNPDSTFGMDP